MFCFYISFSHIKCQCADEWTNFLERVNCNEEDLRGSDESEEQLRLWASYRGQTLTKTGTFSDNLFSFLIEIIAYFCAYVPANPLYKN